MSEEKGRLKRIIVETGTGVAVQGKDHTKAATRAVEDAIHHSSLTLFRSLGLHPDRMQVEILVGAPQPDEIDLDALARCLPFGTVSARAVKGGLRVADDSGGRSSIMVNAAVIVRLALG